MCRWNFKQDSFAWRWVLIRFTRQKLLYRKYIGENSLNCCICQKLILYYFYSLKLDGSWCNIWCIFNIIIFRIWVNRRKLWPCKPINASRHCRPDEILYDMAYISLMYIIFVRSINLISVTLSIFKQICTKICWEKITVDFVERALLI